MARKARAARLPTTMPMIVVRDMEFEPELELEEDDPGFAGGPAEVELPVGASKTLVEVCTVPSEAVTVAATVAGSGPDGYPFSP